MSNSQELGNRLIFIEDSSGTGKVTNADPGRGGSGERTV